LCICKNCKNPKTNKIKKKTTVQSRLPHVARPDSTAGFDRHAHRVGREISLWQLHKDLNTQNDSIPAKLCILIFHILLFISRLIHSNVFS